MRNILLNITFDGSPYHGWQLQQNAKSVSGEINLALKKLFGQYINVVGCSRTDAGVHANNYYCNFKTDSIIPPEKILLALNTFLPGSIAVKECKEVSDEFHSRFYATKKEYIYKILNSSVRNPFLKDYALHYTFPLDENLMEKAAKMYIGKKDFAGFMASGSSIKDTTRTVFEAQVSRQGEMVLFKVSADGFLYNMVRIMVGTLLYVSNGKISLDNLPQLINEKDRSKLGITAPPQGLYLNAVEFKSF